MDVKQIYELVNDITSEVLGQTDLVVAEDLSNVVDLGTALFNANAYDKYVKSLVNHIGKVIFVNRAYRGSAPKVLMDGWEFGSVLEKVSAELPQAQENESWELEDGASYDQDIFYKPTVEAKFYNSKVTFEVPVSFTERQVKQSFSNATQLNAFISMLYNEVDKSMTVKIDSLIMRTIDNMIGETIDADSSILTETDRVRTVNLLTRYNAISGESLTTADCLTDPGFLKYASYIIGLYIARIGQMSTLFNVGGKARFTPKDLLHIVMLNEFASASKTFLESDTFWKELVALPNAETVAFWQGSGTDYAFDSTSTINITTKGGETVNQSGILAVMFDRDALGVCNQDRRVTTHYNAKAEFYNNYYKFDASYFNDLNENFVVFYVAES